MTRGFSDWFEEFATGSAAAAGRQSIFQRGKLIGSVPPNFTPLRLEKTPGMGAFMYEQRPGDFTRTEDGEGWEASKTLGPGDLEAIKGFTWDQDYLAERRKGR
jgi:hypothetical protein